MTTAPPPNAPAGGKTDSGEHEAADKFVANVKGFTFKGRWSGVARAAVIVMSGAAVSVPALVVAIRAPSKAEVSAKVQEKAEEVLVATAKPIDDHKDELTTIRAELARLATIVAFYEKERAAAAAAEPERRQARRQRHDPVTAKKVAAAAQDLKLIAARAAAPAPLSAPKTLPSDAPQVQQPQAPAVPQKPQNGAAGGANP